MSPKRQLSEFLCRELLYDFAIDDLDPIRRSAVEESLQEYPDLEIELQAMGHGIKYVDQLSKTEISEPLFHKVTEEKGFWVAVSKVSAWPNWVKWSLEAGAVAALLAISIQIIPEEFWMKDTSQWQIGKVDPSIGREEIIISESRDEEAAITEKEEAIDSVKEESVAVATPQPGGPEIGSTEEAGTAPPTPRPTKPKAAKSYVIRMSMYSDRVDEITPIIVEKIQSLGGEKAGEVRLGWRKKQGSYFHFMIPESKNSELTRFVSQFGDVRISKDEHSRVMPEGTERYILWVEEVNASTSDENEVQESNP